MAQLIFMPTALAEIMINKQRQRRYSQFLRPFAYILLVLHLTNQIPVYLMTGLAILREDKVHFFILKALQRV